MGAAGSSRRWKFLCGVLAVVTAYSWLREPATLGANGVRAATRGKVTRTPLRVSASAIGVSVPDLVARMLATHDVTEMRRIAERLAAVGGDDVVDALMPLVMGDRVAARDVVLELFGKMGTEHAVETLIGLSTDHRSGVHTNVVWALGESGHPKALVFLIDELARRPTYESVQAVAKFAGESADAVNALARTVTTIDGETRRYAVEALGGVRTETAQSAMRALLDSPSVEVARSTMEYIADIDTATLAKLTEIARSGDGELGATAIEALARAGEPAGPVLASLATEGTAAMREAAVKALGSVKSELAFETLTEIVQADEGELSVTALTAIAALDMPESRDFLISLAMSEQELATTALSELAGLNGEDVDAALLAIAKSESETADRALSHLVDRGNPDAMKIVLAQARGGDDDLERMHALELLATSGQPQAIAAAIDVARGATGDVKSRALTLLGEHGRGDPAVTALLLDSLRGADPAAAVSAAEALADTGTPEARAALVAALAHDDPDVVSAAAASLDSYRIDEETAAALARAAESAEDRTLERNVLRKLLAINSPHGMRLAEAALRQEEEYLAYEALDTLRSVGSPMAMKLIEDTVYTGESFVRAMAVRTLGNRGDSRTVEVIRAALDDTDPHVRGSVAAALGSIGGESAREALLDMSRSVDADDRLAAISNLRSNRDESSQQRMREALRDSDPRVVSYAIGAVANDPRGISELRSVALDSGRPEHVRRAAAGVLERWGELDPGTSGSLAALDALPPPPSAFPGSDEGIVLHTDALGSEGDASAAGILRE